MLAFRDVVAGSLYVAKRQQRSAISAHATISRNSLMLQV